MPLFTAEINTALLITSIDDLRVPYHLKPIISIAAGAATKRLTIVLVSPLFNGAYATDATSARHGISHIGHWGEIQRLLAFLYVQATAIAQQYDRILQDVDVLFCGVEEDLPDNLADGVDNVFRLEAEKLPIDLPPAIQRIPSITLPAQVASKTDAAPPVSSTYDEPSLLPVVALGGTFDHLHAGHKILLSMAAWITGEKLIIGLTDDALLQNKANKHVLEPWTRRSERVRAFLQRFRPGIVYDIVPLSDVAGPTGWDANIQALVVSRETLSGAAAIAKIRKEKGLPPLSDFVIDVISATEANLSDDDAKALREAKLSSTFIRQWIVEKDIATET